MLSRVITAVGSWKATDPRTVQGFRALTFPHGRRFAYNLLKLTETEVKDRDLRHLQCVSAEVKDRDLRHLQCASAGWTGQASRQGWGSGGEGYTHCQGGWVRGLRRERE